MHLSVIICTHNPRTAYLQRTLDALRTQTLDPTRWELLLIDNCSDAPVEGRFDVSWHPRGRIVEEKELGLTPARLRGIRESSAPILCYADDDNVLDPDYLENAVKIGNTMPHIGCWGGEILGEFETPPPAWFKGLEDMLVVRPLDRDHWGNAYLYTKALPCGAGLCVRRTVVDTYLHLCAESPLRKSLDRTGTSTMSGGDQDLAFTAIDMGLGTGRFKALRMSHLIPTGRLDPAYLARLAGGMAESDIYLQYFRSCNPAAIHHRPSRIQQLIRWIEWLKAPAPRRRILTAQRQGRQRALRKLTETQ
jgi:hypothetical protein